MIKNIRKYLLKMVEDNFNSPIAKPATILSVEFGCNSLNLLPVISSWRHLWSGEPANLIPSPPQ